MSTTTPVARRPLEPQRRAIVVGASSGIGAALVGRLVASGAHVAALARRGDHLQTMRDDLTRLFPGADVLTYAHDVTDYDAVPALFDRVVRDLGGLDLIIYAAAVQFPVGLSEYDFRKDEDMLRTNLLGAVAWLNMAAARFERARAGHIVGISSIAGDRGRVGSPVYNTSKAGLDTYLEALRNRLTRHGVTVTTVKPGFVDTDLLKNAPKTFWVISPDEAAALILDAVRARKQVVYVPGRWRVVGTAVRAMPSFIFRRLNF